MISLAFSHNIHLGNGGMFPILLVTILELFEQGLSDKRIHIIVL